jgi:hypothetical protein
MKRKNIFLEIDGDDAGDGSRQHPVASLARAIEISQQGTGNCIVAGNGIYFNTNATLSAVDSGLKIIAAKGAKPKFYGGVQVTGWHVEGDFWVANVPGVKEGKVDFRSLIVNEQFAPRARYPETGEIRHASEFPVTWMSTTKGGWERKPTEEELTTLKIVDDSLPEKMSIKNAELTLYHSWDESLVGVQKWDKKKGIITFSTPSGHPAGAFGDWLEKARTFVVWNIREGMTKPGQWYLDRDNGQIVYWPLPGENIDEVIAYAPTQNVVLKFNGTLDEPLKDITLKGIEIGITTTPLVAGGFGAGNFEGAIEGTYVNNLTIESVTVKWAGGQGIRINNTHKLRCINSTIHNIGAGGAFFSNGTDGLVQNCLIHHNGLTYPSALAMRAGGNNWMVKHNTLHHTPYSAICAGGSKLIFESNRFYNVMEELSDGAAIYIFAGKSCIMRGNYAYNLPDKIGHAYYLDEQSADSIVEGNVATGGSWPIHNHMAWNCKIRDNVCINDTGNMRITFPNCDNFTLTRNVFACSGELIFEPSYTGVAKMINNACFSLSGQYRFTFHDRLPSLERNSTPTPLLPINQGSVMADVGCKNIDGKITYSNIELAKELGLREIDVSDAGC